MKFYPFLCVNNGYFYYVMQCEIATKLGSNTAIQYILFHLEIFNWKLNGNFPEAVCKIGNICSENLSALTTVV